MSTKHSPSTLTHCDDAIWAWLDQDPAPLLVVALRSDERPLKGLSGRVDWRLRGLLSECVQNHGLSGAPGERTLLPISLPSRSLLLVGVGKSRTETELKSILKVAQGLKAQGVALSRSDWGALTDDQVKKIFGGMPVCVSP